LNVRRRNEIERKTEGEVKEPRRRKNATSGEVK
jgi:hypothetical protein